MSAINTAIHTSLAIYSSETAATATASLATLTIAVTRKASTKNNQPRREFFLNIPREILTAPEVPESFRPLVESLLQATIRKELNDWRDKNPLATEINLSATGIDRATLTESALSASKSEWLSSDELRDLFDQSTTWLRIKASDNYKQSAQYRKIATAFRDMVLKLAAKNLTMPERDRDIILAKMDEQDMQTRLGDFIAMRIDRMNQRKESAELDLSAL